MHSYKRRHVCGCEMTGRRVQFRISGPLTLVTCDTGDEGLQKVCHQHGLSFLGIRSHLKPSHPGCRHG